jgi:hypothetical protein
MSSPVHTRGEPRANPWKICPPQVRPLDVERRGKQYRHELLVASAARGADTSSEWLGFAGRILEHTLRQLLGPSAAIEPLLECALTEAKAAWPAALGHEPLPIALQRLATGVALRHLRAAPASSDASAQERPGGVRQLLIGVYAALGKLPPEDRVAFALLELGGHSPVESAAVLGVPAHVVEQRAGRARCRLLFAARRDALLLRYLRLAARWRALSQRLDQRALASLYRAGESRLASAASA